MEFDDVLAYDFFSGSDIGSSYRCLHLLAQGDRKQFDSQKHAVCTDATASMNAERLTHHLRRCVLS